MTDFDRNIWDGTITATEPDGVQQPAEHRVGLVELVSSRFKQIRAAGGEMISQALAAFGAEGPERRDGQHD